MTTNLYLSQSITADRNRSLLEADARRWPEVARAQRLQSARHADEDRALVRTHKPAPAREPKVQASPVHRWRAFFDGLAMGRGVTQR